MPLETALETYREKRKEVRELQSHLDKLANDRRKLSKDIAQGHRSYKTKHRELLEAQAALKPELDKEVQAHPLPADLTESITDTEREEQ